MRVDSEALLDLLPDVVVVMEADSTIVYVNAAVTTILGWAPEDLVGRTGFELVHPDEREEAILRIAAQVEEPEVMRRHHVEIARRDGGFTKFEMLAAVEPGDTGRFLLVLRDISERDEAQKRLHRSDEQLRALTENVPDALGRFDRAGHLEFSTRSFDELVAAESGLLERWAAHAAEVVASGERVDIDHELGGGRWIEVRFVPERTPDGATSHVLVIATDVTARREHEQRLVTAAGHDPLTGLPNRRRLHELAERLALPGPERRRALGAGEGRGVLAAAFIDLDGFKEVNDRYGHAAGDAVLVRVARRLGDVVRPGDVVARLGGDEFVMLCRDVTTDELTSIAERIARTVAEPIHLPDLDEEVRVGASLGVATTESGELDLDRLLDRADHEMYRVKQSRKGS